MPKDTQDDDDTLTVIEPDEPEAKEGEDAAPEPTEAERVAALMGWKRGGGKEGAKSKTAEEFLTDTQDMMRKTRQKAERLETQQARIMAEMAKLTARDRDRMDASQEAALDAAIEAGDTAGAKKILAAARSSTSQPSEHPAFTAFKDRNDWFGVDDEATAYASALDGQYAKAAGGVSDPETHMKKVEAGVKKRFPELFEAAKAKTDDDDEDPPAERRRAPLVARGGRSADRQASNKLTPASMTPKQRAAAKEIRVTNEDYCKSFNEYNGLE